VQVAVLSDLHLGVKDKLDQFYRAEGAEQQLYSLLDYLERTVDKIVLLGDVFETLRAKTFNTEKELVRILKAYPEFASRILDNPKYELIQGNHDLDTVKLLGAKKDLILEDHGEKIYLMHGHQLDPMVSDFWTNHFEHFGVWAGGWFARLGFDWTNNMNKISKKKALEDSWPIGDFEKMSAMVAKDRGCGIVVTGHSHHPMKKELYGALYLNSGARVEGRHDLVFLDTVHKDYDLYKTSLLLSQNHF
tara:strand:- start:1988 stop:2728 length:741 start_codon:yes stop_codon:yes gene_type:complete